jgi:hypothetical protein
MSTYWGTQTVYDYLFSTFNYSGYDGTSTANTIVRLTEGINNPSFVVNPTAVGQSENLTLNFGTGVAPNTAWTSLDAIGHEIAHAIDIKNTNLHALNFFTEGLIIMEGFCDIMGIAVESTKKVNDWKIQNDFNVNEVRHMYNPNNSIANGAPDPQPDTYHGNNWLYSVPSTNYLKHMHHNNGIMNYWFYLLAEGGNGVNDNGLAYNIQPINTNQIPPQSSNSFENAIDLVFETFTKEFKKSDYPIKDFQNLRKATMKVAENEYGCNNNVWNTVRQAWDAVGVTGSTCEIAVKITTNCPSPSTCSANITTCGGSSTGTRIKITGGGLTSPINISATQHNATNLVCGNTYTVEVTDKNNPAECVVIKAFTCQDNAMGSITPLSPPCPIMTASYNVINNCNDKNDLTPLLPEGTYTYNWSNGSTSQNLTNVPSGTYSLTFTDVSNGCSYQESFNVIGLSEPTIIEHVTNLCNAGNQNGAINLMLFNTTAPPYTYQWSTGATTSSLNNLGQGTYNLTITDGNNCTHERSFYVAVKTPAIWGGYALPSCPLRTDGAITPNFVGGTAPYTFQWSNGKTTQNINNLSVGSYKLTITDANGCIASKTFNVTPETSYTFADDLGNCKRIYTCHGQTYSEDMLDYDNISYNFNDCVMTIPCSIQNGNSLSSGGSIQGWFLTNTTEKCRFTCQLGNVAGTGKPTDPDPTIIQSTIPCEKNGAPGFFHDYFCNGVLVKSKCIKISGAKISNNLNDILVQPNPFDKNVSIQFETDFSGSATVQLYSVIGQEVFVQPIQIGQGTNRFDFDFIDILPDGVYFLTVNLSNGNRYTQKLIHQN